MKEENKTVLFFDGVCNLCNGLVRFIIRQDKTGLIKFSPLQSAYANKILESKNINPEELNTLIYLSNNKVYFRSSAVLQILKNLGGIWKIFYFLKIIPGFIRDLIYNMIAGLRYKVWGRKDKCMVPDEKIIQRFLLYEIEIKN